MKFDLDNLQQCIKDVLTPIEYQAWLEKIKEPGPKDHPCLVEAFFQREAEKPVEIRQNFCMISCNCHKCVPYHM